MSDGHMDGQHETIIPCHYCVAAIIVWQGIKSLRLVHQRKDEEMMIFTTLSAKILF